MTRILSALRVLTAAAIVIMAVLLCWQCIDIYTVGNAPQNLDANGVHLTSVFRMDDVASRLKSLAAPLSLCMLLVAVTAVLHLVAGERPSRCAVRNPDTTSTARPHEIDDAKLHWLRGVFLSLALAFILLGVMNGGLYDVLVKAINICTECIGLG